MKKFLFFVVFFLVSVCVYADERPEWLNNPSSFCAIKTLLVANKSNSGFNKSARAFFKKIFDLVTAAAAIKVIVSMRSGTGVNSVPCSFSTP